MSKPTAETIKRTLDLALDVSFSVRDMTMLKQALDKGADAQRTLVEGHRMMNWQMVDLALGAGADINAAVDGTATGDTFLIKSMRNEQYSLVQGYLERKADPNVMLGEESALEVLLKQMKKRSSSGNSPTDQQRSLYKSLMTSLPEAGAPEADVALKKEVVLRAPQAAFKGAGAKPAP